MRNFSQAFAALGLLAAFSAHATASDTPAQSPGAPHRVDLLEATPSEEARKLVAWILDANNHRGLPFLVIDKKQAMVFAFHPDGRLRGMAPALLGMAVGDDSAPGIGQRKLAAIRPGERTTPAGRFVAALDYNLHGVDILWVDYDAAISLHRVVAGTPKERRAERLVSPSASDNRVSYGCINVPATFFDEVVKPAFTGTNGIVYVLPETRSAQSVFGSDDGAQPRAAASPATVQGP